MHVDNTHHIWFRTPNYKTNWLRMLVAVVRSCLMEVCSKAGSLIH